MSSTNAIPLMNRGTQNNELAKLLAAQTDALILASATPHNGKPESFAELVQRLDPTAIVYCTKYTAKDIEHLDVRRHRNSPDVKLEVAHKWANNDALQGFSKSSLIQWRPTSSANSRTPGCILRVNRWSPAKADNCFPGPCLRPFCRHQKLCAPSIKRRIATIGDASTPEVKALRRLDDLAEKAQASTPSKLIRLVEHLRVIGIANNSDVRVVIFSERIDTLTWLQQEVTKRLKLPANAVETLHAGLPDEKITDVPESFGQSGSDIRVLPVTDMASEGLNLHQECHQLVHYDLPWSFIPHPAAQRPDRSVRPTARATDQRAGPGRRRRCHQRRAGGDQTAPKRI